MAANETWTVQIEDKVPNGFTDNTNEVDTCYDTKDNREPDGIMRSDFVQLNTGNSHNSCILKCHSYSEGVSQTNATSQELKYLKCRCNVAPNSRHSSYGTTIVPKRQNQVNGVVTKKIQINQRNTSGTDIKESCQLHAPDEQIVVVICELCNGSLALPISELLKVTCAFCNEGYVAHNSRCPLVLCPSCKKLSCLDEKYVHRRKFGFLAVSIVLFALTLGFTAATLKYYNRYKGLLATYAALYLFDVVIFIISIIYFRLRVSQAESFSSR